MPITSKCNSKCLTCNVWKQEKRIDLDPIILKEVLKDNFFSKVETVGLNGGELTLYKEYEKLLSAVLSLKSIKTIHIISNGLITKKILSLLEYSKKICTNEGVSIGFTISIDGISGSHDFVRGIKGAYEKTINSLELILQEKEKYCDYIEVGCTVSKYNVGYLSAIDSTLSAFKIPIIYHLAVPNKRIKTFNNSDYSVFEDERARILAAEFFFTQFLTVKSKLAKFRNFSTYYFLLNKGKYRLSACDWLRRDVTIDENLNLYLCATASENIGNLRENPASFYLAKKRFNAIENDISNLCDSCIHYNSLPTIKGLIVFLVSYLNEIFNWKFKFKPIIKW